MYNLIALTLCFKL